MQKIIWHGKVITIEELCVVESLRAITDTMHDQDPYCYEVSLRSMGDDGFTEYELIQEYLEWCEKPLVFE